MIRLTLILFLISRLVVGQDMRGSIGVITISDNYDNSDHKLEFLNGNGTVWYTLDLYKEWKPKEDFRILAFKPDYFLFHIRCKEQTPTGFNVVVNEDTGLTKLLMNSNKLKFQTWEEYVINVFSVDFDRSNVKIYDKVGGTPIKESPENHKIFVPKEVHGEWMRIIWSTTDEYPSETTSNQTGWIKWKNEDRIMLELYHLS